MVGESNRAAVESQSSHTPGKGGLDSASGFGEPSLQFGLIVQGGGGQH
jgi:hypothetical protein